LCAAHKTIALIAEQQSRQLKCKSFALLI